MSSVSNILIGLGGLFLGMLALSRVLHWLVTIYTLLKPRASHAAPRGASVLFVALFGSGLWVAAATVLLVYFARGRPWAPPLFVGMGSSIMASAFVMAKYYRVLRSKRAAA